MINSKLGLLIMFSLKTPQRLDSVCHFNVNNLKTSVRQIKDEMRLNRSVCQCGLYIYCITVDLTCFDTSLLGTSSWLSVANRPRAKQDLQTVLHVFKNHLHIEADGDVCHK